MKLTSARALAFALAAATLTAVAPGTARAQGIGLAIGTQAPNASVSTLDGQKADLSAFIGKTPTLIEFWATWCPNCRELRPVVRAMADKYGDRVKFVGIAVSVNENPKRVKAFVAKYHIPGTQFFDTDGDASG